MMEVMSAQPAAVAAMTGKDPDRKLMNSPADAPPNAELATMPSWPVHVSCTREEGPLSHAASGECVLGRDLERMLGRMVFSSDEMKWSLRLECLSRRFCGLPYMYSDHSTHAWVTCHQALSHLEGAAHARQEPLTKQTLQGMSATDKPHRFHMDLLTS
jgi:hypothetical protein